MVEEKLVMFKPKRLRYTNKGNQITCKLPPGINFSDIYGTTFTFLKALYPEDDMLERISKLRSKAWVLCQDDDFWYVIHDERIFNLMYRK